jgi:hypothetical protein
MLEEHAASILKITELVKVDAVGDAVEENMWVMLYDLGKFG